MSGSVDPKRRLLRKLAWSLFLGVFLLMSVLLLWRSHPGAIYWTELPDEGYSLIEENPWALVAVMATLPGLGFPSSPTLMLFGVVVAGPLKRLLRSYLLRERTLPEMSEYNAIRLGLILRLTPGIHYALQNIILSIAGMRFRDYLLVSIPTTSLWTACFVITGGAISKGQLGWAMTGLVILIVVTLATRMWSRKNPTNVG